MATKLTTKPRKSASQQRSRATVDALVEATARILVSDGFDKASTNRIAEVAGVSVGSLYQYFPSKEALAVAVAERHHREIMRIVGQALAEVGSLPIERGVRKLIEAAIDAHRVDPELHRVLAEQIPRTGRLEQIDPINREAYAMFEAYLEARKDELRILDVELAAFICATSIEALTHNAVLHRVELSSRRAATALVDETCRLILGYLKQA